MFQMLRSKREIKSFFKITILDNFIFLTAEINICKSKRKRFWIKNDKNETKLKDTIYRSKKNCQCVYNK